MAGRIAVDTSFLIDLRRERPRGGDGPAHHVLAAEPEAELLLSATALGEFTEGFDEMDDPV